MYKIERKVYGYKLTFADYIKADEMKKWVDDSKKTLTSAPQEFGVFVDMRTLKTLPQDSQEYMQQGQSLYKQKGMARSVVILSNPLTKLQFTRIARETGIYQWERYIDASAVPDWEKKGEEWLLHKIDPDK